MTDTTATLATSPIDALGAEDAAGPDAPPPSPAADASRPGYCSVHPGVALVAPGRFPGWPHWDSRDNQVLCPDAEHTSLDRERCTYCGRELHRLTTHSAWRYGSRRTTCSETCRNYLWRWRRRLQRPSPATSVAR
jgi:hypothetical protein